MTKGYYIVNEDGLNIHVVDGRGTDGFLYQLDQNDKDTAHRIVPDEEGCWITGTFTRHDKPFKLEGE